MHELANMQTAMKATEAMIIVYMGRNFDRSIVGESSSHSASTMYQGNEHSVCWYSHTLLLRSTKYQPAENWMSHTVSRPAIPLACTTLSAVIDEPLKDRPASMSF